MKTATKIPGYLALVVSALIALGTVFAPPAAAGEDAYIDHVIVALGGDGTVSLPPDLRAEAIWAGRMLCGFMKSGMPRERVAMNLISPPSRITYEQALGVAYAAQRHLCPETAQ